MKNERDRNEAWARFKEEHKDDPVAIIQSGSTIKEIGFDPTKHTPTALAKHEAEYLQPVTDVPSTIAIILGPSFGPRLLQPLFAVNPCILKTRIDPALLERFMASFQFKEPKEAADCNQLFSGNPQIWSFRVDPKEIKVKSLSVCELTGLEKTGTGYIVKMGVYAPFGNPHKGAYTKSGMKELHFDQKGVLKKEGITQK